MPVDSAGAKRTRRRAGGELENEILAALWAMGRPLTPREVHDTLGADLAYNTVQTILVRLHEKGLVQRHPYGRAHRYSPTKQRAELTAERMHLLLTAGPDRRSVLRRFVGALDETDEQILRDVLGRVDPPEQE
jgi:predicted transcriptional regulator